MPERVTRPAKRRKPPAAWLPREHGAWSWLVSPVVAGAIIAGPHLHQLFLLGVALSGYFVFNAASWWARMPATRRHGTVRPILTYAAVAAVFSIGLLVTAGWGALGWLVVLAVPVAVSYVLTLRGAARSLASGLATAVAASALLLVAVQPNFLAFLRDPRPEWLGAAGILYAATAGTLFAVKSMIRQKGSNRFLAVSIAWHVGCLIVTAIGTLHGLALAWPAYFLLTTVRATALPLVARRHAIRPMVIGLVELGLTLMLLALYARPGI